MKYIRFIFTVACTLCFAPMLAQNTEQQDEDLLLHLIASPASLPHSYFSGAATHSSSGFGYATDYMHAFHYFYKSWHRLWRGR